VKRTVVDDALLALARMAMDASVRAADEIGGVSPVQLRALTALRQSPGANLANLAERMGITVSTTSRLVDRLVTADWVHRHPAPGNRREVALTLTEVGRALLRSYDDRRLARLRDCLDRVPEDRRDAVVGALSEFAGLVRA
jgi:DNA-binding MarR family transcriptional regulator